MLIKQSSAVQHLVFLMIDSSDHLTGKTGLSPTVTLSKNGSAFTAPTGAVSEIANGWYKVAANTNDTDTLGPLVLHAEASGGGTDPVDMLIEVVAYDPQDATGMGLTRLDVSVSSRSSHDAAAVAGLILLTPANKLATGGDGYVTVITNNDKTGYGLATALPSVPTAGEIASSVWSASTRTLSAFAFLTSAAIADAVWDEASGDHTAANTTGAMLASAATAGDPLASAVPGTYVQGTAGSALARIADIQTIVQAGSEK